MSTATVGLLSSAATAACSLTRSGAGSSSGSGNGSPDHLTIIGTMNSSTFTFSSCHSSLSLSFSPRKTAPFTRRTRVSCEVAIKSDSTTSSSSSSSSSSDLSASSSSPSSDEDASGGEAKIGARVRVKVPLKVYHVPKVPELDLLGKEGQIKQYVGLWKGKRISANLPYKVEFFTEVEGRGSVKFFAHLREDEFEYV